MEELYEDWLPNNADNSWTRSVFLNAHRVGKSEASNSYALRGRTTQFNIGQLVKLKTGKSPQRVTDRRWNHSQKCVEIRCEYLTSGKVLEFRPESNYEIYIETTKEELKENTMKGKLYQTLDGSMYGEYLVTDADGKYVLKLTTGEYKAYDAAELKRVMPFTFDVVFNGMSGKRYSYLGTAGSVDVGDILMEANDFTIARVVAVNTESELANKKFVGAKLATVAL